MVYGKFSFRISAMISAMKPTIHMYVFFYMLSYLPVILHKLVDD
jgi:hypothetical protein